MIVIDFDEFEWKPSYSNWNCEYYGKGNIKFGYYEHTLYRDYKPDEEYHGYIVLPSLKKISRKGTREQVKEQIEKVVKEWFNLIK
jgi:hypothetical protein